jgi:hypothetical protein
VLRKKHLLAALRHESPSEAQTPVNVSETEQTTGHEDFCCDDQIVGLLKNVSTVFIICNAGTIKDVTSLSL